MLSTNTTASAAAMPVSMCRPRHASAASATGRVYRSPTDSPRISAAPYSMSDSEANDGKIRVILVRSLALPLVPARCSPHAAPEDKHRLDRRGREQRPCQNRDHRIERVDE